MTRHLFILSRRVPEFYSYLVERFADDDAVEVILDRRQALTSQVPERFAVDSGPDRRRRPEVDAELLTRSHTVVTISDTDGRQHQRSQFRRRRAS